MTKLRSNILAGLAVLCLSPLSALGQTMGPFQVEVDCGGVFMGGDSVPYLITAQNQTLEAQPIQLSLRLRGPFGVFPLFTTDVTLGPNQDIALNRSLGLPATVPNGNYTLVIIGAGTSFTSFDTCSFNVM
jgi:hypothetical protein